MKIAIVGIGGVGGYLGAKLCSLIGTQKKKYEIVFIARGTQAEALKEKGLRIIEDESEFTATPSAVCRAEEAEGLFDLILVCIKSDAISEVLLSLKKNTHPDTVFMLFGDEGNTTEMNMPQTKIIHAHIEGSSHIQEPGVIRKYGKDFTAVFGDPIFIGESLFIDYMFKDAAIQTKLNEEIF